MKTTLLIAALCFTFFGASLAQAPVVQSKGIIKGTLTDSTKKQPLSFVTVLLKDIKTNQPEKTTLTKDDGTFEIAAPLNKSYEIIFAFIGYKSKTFKVPAFGDKKTIDLGKILLAETSGQLQEVSIVAAKPLVKQEVDRIAYDVQADPESKEVSALDMMRKVPMLTVDGNDNIQLKGSANYKILINGKESALMAKSPSDVLKSMPGTNIQKIEVITTPPAKYDAEGLAGIINIITKKNADEGYNGSINARTNNKYGPGANLNLTAKKGKMGFNSYIGYFGQGTQTNGSTNTQNLFATQSLIAQNASNVRTGHGQYGEVDLSYEIDTLNLLTTNFNLFNGFNNVDKGQSSLQTNNLGVPTQQFFLNNNGYDNYTGLDAGINYEIGFKKDKQQLLTLSYKYSYSPDKEFNDNSYSDTFNFNDPNFQQYNNSGNKEHTFQLDYVQPLNKQLNVEAGGKAILRNNFSDFENDNFSTATNTYVINPAQTNNFNYHQDVYSLYNSYQLKLEKWTAKAGLRLEHTQIDADFTSVGSDLHNGYSNFIPSISMQRSFKTSSITLGFTERVQRPGIYQLNPFVNTSNPKFLTTGNPNLNPELSNSFELNYSNFAKNTINVGLSYAFSNNSIQNVTDTLTQKGSTVTESTYQNLGSNKSLGLNVNTNINFTKAFNLSLSGQVRSVWLKGTYNGQFYTNQGFVGNGFGGATYKFDDGFRLGVNGSIYSGNVNLQGHNSYGLYSSLLISKELMKKNLTLALVCNNPWSTYFNYTSTTTTPDFSQQSINQNTYRTFALRFNYKFGKLASEIKKNQRGINNDDTKGGKSGGN